MAAVSPIRPTMFLLNDLQIADAFERTHADLTGKYESGVLRPTEFNAGVQALDELWAHFFPQQIPDWHYTEPPEEDDADLRYAEF